MKKLRDIFATSAALFFASAQFVSAQSYRYEYNMSPQEAQGAFAAMSAVWIVLFCCLFVVGLAVYIFSSIQYAKVYTKNGMEDKKILAFIPIVQNYYFAKAVGDKEYAWVQVAIPLGMLISIPLCFVLIGFCLIFPLAIASLIFSVRMFLMAATRMGRDNVWGLLASLGGFIPMFGIFLQLYSYYYIAEGTPVIKE